MAYPGVFSTCVRDRRRLLYPLPRSHVCFKMKAFNAPDGWWPRRMAQANLGDIDPGCPSTQVCGVSGRDAGGFILADPSDRQPAVSAPERLRRARMREVSSGRKKR